MVGIIVGVFLIFSISISWVAGDKEKSKLEDTIKETKSSEQSLEYEVNAARRQLTVDSEQMKNLEDNLKAEIAEKKRLEKALALEERQKRMALSSAKSDASEVDIDKERDKIRAELETKSKQDITNLEAKLQLVEESKKRLEAEVRLKIEEEARKKAETAWTQAELARVRAQEASLRLKDLEKKFKDMEMAKQAVESALKKQELVKKDIEKKLAAEEKARKTLEARLKETDRSMTTAKLPAVIEAPVETAIVTPVPVIASETITTAKEAPVETVVVPPSATVAAETITVKEVPVQADTSAIIAELEKSRDEARRKIAEGQETIAALERNLARITKEKELIAKEASDNALRLTELTGQVNQSIAREAETKRLLEAHLAANAVSTEQDKKAAELASTIALLESRLIEAEQSRKQTEESARGELDNLRKRSEDLSAQNRALDEKLRDAQSSIAQSDAASQMARDLIAHNAELEGKLKEAGLVNIQGKAANYVAQKLIEKNTEIEIKLKNTELSLLKSEAARTQAEGVISQNKELASKLKDAQASLVSANSSAVAVESLSRANANLEVKIKEAAEAMAQADAARYMAEELNTQNKVLEEKLAGTTDKKAETDKALSDLRAIRKTFEERLAQEIAAKKTLEAKLYEAEVSKNSGAESVKDVEAARQQTEQRLSQELAARKAIETRLTEAENAKISQEAVIKNLAEARRSLEAQLKAETDAKRTLEAKLRDADLLREKEASAFSATLNDTISAKKQLEEQLNGTTSARRLLEARLDEGNATIKTLQDKLLTATAVSVPADVTSLSAETYAAEKSAMETKLAGEIAAKKTLEAKLNEMEMQREKDTRALNATLNDTTLAKGQLEEKLSSVTIAKNVLEARLNEGNATIKTLQDKLLTAAPVAVPAGTAAEAGLVYAAEKAAIEAMLAGEIAAKKTLETQLKTESDAKKTLEAKLNEMEASRSANTELAKQVSVKSAAEPGGVVTASDASMNALLLERQKLEANYANEAGARKTLEARLQESEDAKNSFRTTVKDLEASLKETETKLATGLDSMRTLEARLRESDMERNASKEAIKGLEQALKQSDDRLARETEARRHLESEIARISKEADALRKNGQVGGMAVLKEEFKGLKDLILDRIKNGEITPEEVVKLMHVEDVLGFYVVQEGDTLWDIASNESIYGNPLMWPLIYRYNTTKIKGPDIIHPEQLLIIYKNVPEAEADDAIEKARTRGRWRRWSDAARQEWLTDWGKAGTNEETEE